MVIDESQRRKHLRNESPSWEWNDDICKRFFKFAFLWFGIVRKAVESLFAVLNLFEPSKYIFNNWWSCWSVLLVDDCLLSALHPRLRFMNEDYVSRRATVEYFYYIYKGFKVKYLTTLMTRPPYMRGTVFNFVGLRCMKLIAHT